MKKIKLTFNACLKGKRMYLNRLTVTVLGNPSHLGFWYDEDQELLFVSAAGKDDLDAYEIPKHYWRASTNPCAMSRIAFLKALQHRLGWEDDYKYSYAGTLIEREAIPVVAFDMNNGVRLR
jgi:hypothetical protein